MPVEPLAPFRAPRSAYIHVPFCRHRCGYCDFTLVAGRDDLIERYLSAMERELATLETPRSVDTLFLGGGTPTHLAPGQLERFLKLLRTWFDLAHDAEFSVEANPRDLLESDRVNVLARLGVNRISLGVQSFDDAVLLRLERDHRAEEVERVVEHLSCSIPNVALDLIFGVPGQTLESWRKTLDRAIALRPAHVSTYGLTFEKGTTFWTRRSKGELSPAPEDLEYEMYALAMDQLPAAGFGQYELSNFARPARECRHNETYWAGHPCFAFGPGAARYIAGVREIGHRSTTSWLAKVEAGESPIGYREELTAEDRAREALIVGLRRNRGVSRDEFARDHGFSLDELGGPAWDRLCQRGLIAATEDGYRLTRAGRFLADTVTVEFVGTT
ncbi:MAG: radical SAM family heme chaperone HemW [Planctomycetota bacterium]|nr:radical SAM family heme chaperone HemW [Planctomycetota bacterium]